jgi:hypothetical protein
VEYRYDAHSPEKWTHRGIGEIQALWCSVMNAMDWVTTWFPTTLRMSRRAASTVGPGGNMEKHQDPLHEGKHPELKDKIITPDVILHPHNASLQLTLYDGKQFPSEYQVDIFAAEHGS